jgi:hypothetical protein
MSYQHKYYAHNFDSLVAQKTLVQEMIGDEVGLVLQGIKVTNVAFISTTYASDYPISIFFDI